MNCFCLSWVLGPGLASHPLLATGRRPLLCSGQGGADGRLPLGIALAALVLLGDCVHSKASFRTNWFLGAALRTPLPPPQGDCGMTPWWAHSGTVLYLAVLWLWCHSGYIWHTSRQSQGRRGLSSSIAAEFDRASPAQSCSPWGGPWWGLTAGSWGGSLGGQSGAAGLVAGSMDISLSLVAREASQGLSPGLNGFPRPAPPKTTKKPKKAVLFFEVEILDAKTREKLCFLDKVGLQCP